MPYYELYYHFIWTTKNRVALITEVNRNPIYATIQDKVVALNGVLHALNGMPDHIHLVASVPPSVKVSDFIGQIKGVSSHLAKSLTNADAFAWQNDYGVLSISKTHMPTIIRYVENQQNHHADQTLHIRLERSTQPDDEAAFD